MSVLYFLHINLDVQYTKKNVNQVIKDLFDYGCIFLAKEDDRLLVEESPFLTPDQATIKIVDATDEVRYLCEDTLSIKYKDTYCDLRFYQGESGLLSVYLFDFPCAWGKEFQNGAKDFVIDFARYINLGIDVIRKFSVLRLEMSSDHSDGWPDGIEKKCIVAIVCLGPLDNPISGSSEGVKGSVESITTNAKENSIVFFDENTDQPTEPSVQKCYDMLKIGFPGYLYAKKDDISFKIEIKQNVQLYDGITIHPLEPYLMKKGYGSEDEKIDIAFYVQRLLELCENFAIYELKTFF